MAVDTTARNLTDRVDALASALQAAGVPPEQSAGLLAAAARAAMNAVLLDALLDEGTAGTAAVASESTARLIRLAA